jgi:hypothetical protein
MSDPCRIQRKRTKGWRMPEGAIYVGRPTKWGNPFSHAEKFAGRDWSLRCYRMAANGYWNPEELKDMPDGPFHIACRDFSDWMKLFSIGVVNEAKEELRGKDLACWCSLDQPCHADVLLEIANQ